MSLHVAYYIIVQLLFGRNGSNVSILAWNSRKRKLWHYHLNLFSNLCNHWCARNLCEFVFGTGKCCLAWFSSNCYE